MANTGLKFFRVNGIADSGLTVGGIYFDHSTGRIYVATAADKTESYGGIVDAAYSTEGDNANKLIITKADGSNVTLDFSDVASASSTKSILSSLRDSINTNTNNISANTTAIGVLNGNASTTGSVAKAVADAKSEVVGDAATDFNTLGKIEDKIQGMDLAQVGADGSYIKLVSEADGVISAEKQAFDTAVSSSSTNSNAPTSKAVYDYVEGLNTAMDTRVKAITTEIGTKAVAESAEGAGDGKAATGLYKYVDDAAADAVATVVAGADAKYDTLKEIADYIASDTTGAADMVSDIKNLQDGTGLADGTSAPSYTGANYISSAATLVAADKALDTQVKANADAIGAEKTRAEGVEGSLSSLTTTAKGTLVAAINEVDANADAAKSAADAAQADADALEALHATADGKMVTVATEVSNGIAAIAEASKSNTAGSDVVVTVKTKAGSVSDVAVDASVLAGKVSAEETRAKAAEKTNADAITLLNNTESTSGSVKNTVKSYIDNLDVTSNTSDATKGVTVAVTETDGKVNKPVVGVTAATVTYTAKTADAAANLSVTANEGNVLDSTAIAAIKSYVDAADKVNADTISTEVTRIDGVIGTVPAKVGDTATANVVAYIDAKTAAAEAVATSWGSWE